mgnify:CR=1 FL=1
MAAKLFYRERRKVKDGEKKPRFRIVAVHDCKLKVFMDHFRMNELKQLAKETGAELVALKGGENKGKK